MTTLDVASLAVRPETRGHDSLFDIAGDWFLAWVKFKEETILASRLEQLGIDYYLPLVQRTTRRFGKRQTELRPLFPGYLALAGDQNSRYEAIQTAHTMRVIPVVQREKFVRELESVRIAVTADPRIGQFKGIVKGRPCRVTGGPFMGYEGLVDEFIKDGKDRRIGVKCHMMGRALVIDVPEDLIEIVGEYNQ